MNTSRDQSLSQCCYVESVTRAMSQSDSRNSRDMLLRARVPDQHMNNRIPCSERQTGLTFRPIGVSGHEVKSRLAVLSKDSSGAGVVYWLTGGFEGFSTITITEKCWTGKVCPVCPVCCPVMSETVLSGWAFRGVSGSAHLILCINQHTWNTWADLSRWHRVTSLKSDLTNRRIEMNIAGRARCHPSVEYLVD